MLPIPFVTAPAPRFRDCRLCGGSAPSRELVKYGVRHYAHAGCLFRAKGAVALEALHAHQVRQLPVLELVRAGYAPAGEILAQLENLERAAVARAGGRHGVG